MPYHPDTLSDWFETAVKAAKLPRIRLHDTCHTATSLMLAPGVPTKGVSGLLGQSSPTITLSVPAHVIPGMAEDAGAAPSASLLGSDNATSFEPATRRANRLSMASSSSASTSSCSSAVWADKLRTSLAHAALKFGRPGARSWKSAEPSTNPWIRSRGCPGVGASSLDAAQSASGEGSYGTLR